MLLVSPFQVIGPLGGLSLILIRLYLIVFKEHFLQKLELTLVILDTLNAFLHCFQLQFHFIFGVVVRVLLDIIRRVYLMIINLTELLFQILNLVLQTPVILVKRSDLNRLATCHRLATAELLLLVR